MNCGSSAESPSAWRTFLIAVFRPCSKSTKVSLCHSPLAQFLPGGYLSMACEQRSEHQSWLLLQAYAAAVAIQVAGNRIELERSEADSWRSVGLHGRRQAAV